MDKKQLFIGVVLIAVAAVVLFPSTFAKGKPACNDRIDNDGDGLVDMNDPGCTDAGDRSELNPNAECDDGIDNDGDGLADYRDTGCSGPTDTDESNCGDTVCEGAETQANCPQDCGYANSCSDTDGGNNIGIVGTTSGYYNNNAYSHTDSCAGDSIITEYYCSGNLEVSQQQSCQYGCANGACNPATDSCNDTDGGIVLNIAGGVYGYAGGRTYNLTDYCLGNYTIVEYSCNGTQKIAGNYSCSSGNFTGCYNSFCF